ncbi:histidine kinase [Kaistia terrae]|jgi:membrane-bound acyltransferase YfiQ involved in biofilm formation|uniref:Histidine kinase n=1 Tax=Kaistia terrae TaxID=537017 RepID=A0ABW0Q2G4_9HYPH|nr:histidine kinase [Kaistia terrae]MCX5581249.1 histidine kinase [Kaistia terrae]
MAITTAYIVQKVRGRFMPTLSRFIVACILLALAGYAVVFSLANFVEPSPREITIRVPTDRLLQEP